jgi:hypothetical protein
LLLILHDIYFNFEQHTKSIRKEMKKTPDIPEPTEVSPEKLAIVATKGLRAAKLSKGEMAYLATPEGAQALCKVLDSLKASTDKTVSDNNSL